MTSRLLFAALLALSSTWALAQEAKVTIKVETDGPYWVGQQISLAVMVYAPGYFDSSVSFDLPDPAGVLLMRPTDHPVVGNETIDDTLYVTQWHELRAWPMRPGAQTIPAITVRFQYKNAPLADNALSASATTTPVSLNVEAPPGTEGIGLVISAHQLTVDEQWQPTLDSTEIKAGEALTRTITFSAPDVPGMIFPPFPTTDIDGLGVYSKPQVQDETDSRGALVGKRLDVITYVAKQPGQYTIPAAQFSWFDIDDNELHTQQFDAYTFNVIPNPDMASADTATAQQADVGGVTWLQNWRYWIGVIVFAALVIFLCFSHPVQAYLARMLRRFRPLHLKQLYPGDN